MFAVFLIAVSMISVVGPGHIEGGFDAIAEKGPKAALVQAYEERQPFDYSKMN